MSNMDYRQGDAGDSDDSGIPPAPPSYEQATRNPTQYPPVKVLQTPSLHDLNRLHSPQGSAATNYVGQHQQRYVPPPDSQQHQYRMQQPPPPPPPQQEYSFPPQQGGLPTTGAQQSIVIIQQATALPLGPEAAYIICPACQIQHLTRIEYEPSTRTHLMAALLCILGLWCCVCLPYCAGSCMNINHYCGNCNKFLGSYGKDL